MPARGSTRWFYAREKAELERRLLDAAAAHDDVELTIMRPTVVVGPQTSAASADLVPPGLRRLLGAVPGGMPAIAIPQRLQLVHEEDVADAFARALIDGPGGTFNLAGSGTVSGRELMRAIGLAPLPLPDVATRTLARGLMRLPRLPAALEAAEAFTEPVLMDCSRAHRALGWRPRHTSREALRHSVTTFSSASATRSSRVRSSTLRPSSSSACRTR
jgi:nucleoside-diphosphate-sugar epimerase